MNSNTDCVVVLNNVGLPLRFLHHFYVYIKDHNETGIDFFHAEGGLPMPGEGDLPCNDEFTKPIQLLAQRQLIWL